MMRLLLLSNSVGADGAYLTWAGPELRKFLGEKVRTLFFVPYAGVTMSAADYTRKVGDFFGPLGVRVVGAHESDNHTAALRTCDAVAVGGGNTFHLVRELRRTGLLALIGDAVRAGMPYIGWSAGSNVACPTIRTTNDMPIVDPGGLDSFGFLPWQINAHFTDAHPPNHRGETRRERIAEFLAANPGEPVLALPEGTGLLVTGEQIDVFGASSALVFRAGREPEKVRQGTVGRDQ